MKPLFKKSIYSHIWPAVLATLLWLLPGTSNATLLNAGESAIFNFDFVSALPANVVPVNGYPLYEIESKTLVSSVDINDNYGLTYYDDLNGVGQSLQTSFTNVGPTAQIDFTISGIEPFLFDGIFSIAEVVTAGSVDFGPLTVTGYFNVTDPSGGQIPETLTIAGTPGTFNVPEPPTLVLFILGLVVLMSMPRRVNTVTSWI